MSGAPYRTELGSHGNGLFVVRDFDFTVSNYFLVPVGNANVGTIHLRFTKGSRTTGVATLIVSNDAAQAERANHPAAVTLGASTIAAPFETSYGFIGLEVTTAESGLVADVYIKLSTQSAALSL
jgi:hypothetical protein